MKIIITIVISLIISGMSNAQNLINIDVEKSTVKWLGSSMIYFNDHYGTVEIENGLLTTKDGRISAGIFQIDMKTIENVDGGFNQSLVDHLKDPDFFDVANFPTATIEIMRVKYHSNIKLECVANLTIKGITKEVNIIADVDTFNGRMRVQSKFKIDRSRWDIRYGSKSFFSDLGDKAISDVITFEVSLIAK